MLIKNGTIATLWPASLTREDIRVKNGNIVARARNLRPKAGERIADLDGKIIMPGLVNAHTHLYSALARGMAGPKQPPKDFIDILKKIWWKLDESLDEESIYYSALVGSIDAVRCGTTALIDHHASPNRIYGSLDIIKNAMSQVGLRGILCYETTDRGGEARRNAGLFENDRFVRENVGNANFRGTVGAHASFTLSDETCAALSDLAAMHGCGVHIHVAEDYADVADSKKRKQKNIIERLESFGLLSDKSILAHGVHLTQAELRRTGKAESWLIHNPRSNMNNSVGYAPLRWFGENSALGTDGFPADMFEESKFGFFRNQESNHKSNFTRIPELLHSGQNLLSKFFSRDFGHLDAGSPADLVVLDYVSPTPLSASNLLGHFLFGMSSRNVLHTMIDGRWAMYNRKLVGIDETMVMCEAAKVAQRLWKRMTR